MRTEFDDGRQYTLALRPGTLLDGIYRVTRVASQSSTFAVTYVAQDERAAEQVVIKEFLPRTLAGRAPDELTIFPHSADDQSTFSRALRRFLREADVLADIAHPHIPRVRRSFEANGTAYLVFQHYEGRTLTEHLAATGNRLPPDYATALVLQVLHGLGTLHTAGIIHGYITPDNILVDANARALLLGLGTTRHVVGPSREPVAGFAPIEQYAAREVGPWTDVYACAAVLYRLTTGLTPPSAVERSAGQMVTLPLSLAPALARAVLGALAQLPDTRPHSAEEFRRRLDASLALGAEASAPPVEHRPVEHRPVEHRPINARRPAPEPVEAVSPASTEVEFEPESPRYDDDFVLLTDLDRPQDRVRRFFRLMLGIGGATAGILLVVSVLGGRKNDEWAGAAVVAASPALATTARTYPGATTSLPVETDSPSRPVVDAPAQPSPAPKPSFEQPVTPPPRATAPTQHAPPRSPKPISRPVVQAGSSAMTDRAPVTPAGRPPSVTVSLAPTLGRLELLPSEVLTGLRERLAHGKENNEFGQYAIARRIFRGALDQIAKLDARYSGAQSLTSLKKELEQAADRSLAACVAENEVIRRRNGKAVECD